MAEIKESRDNFYSQFKKTIVQEIAKAKGDRKTELSKIDYEVSAMKNRISKQELILIDEIEMFYTARIRTLEQFLKESSILENLPNPDKSEIGLILSLNQEKMKKDLLEILKEKIDGKAKYEVSFLTGRHDIGSVKISHEGMKNFKLTTTNTTVSNFNFFISSAESIMVLSKNFQTGRNEWINLETNKKEIIEKPKFYINIFDNQIKTEISLNHYQYNYYINYNRQILQKNTEIRHYTSYVIYVNDSFYGIDLQGELFGPNFRYRCSLEKEISDKNEKLSNLLEEMFTKKNCLFLFSKEKIFLLDIKTEKFIIYLQENLFGNKERIVASRKINENEIALVFQNIRNPNENLIIKYYKCLISKRRLLSDIQFKKIMED